MTDWNNGQRHVEDYADKREATADFDQLCIEHGIDKRIRLKHKV